MQKEVLVITYEDYQRYLEKQRQKGKILFEVAEEDEEYQIENNETAKIHDKLFRELLNNKEEFTSFMRDFINNKINLNPNEIEKYNRSFITKDYKIRESDIIYKIKNKNVFLLVEHQSKIDYKMPYRMAEYSFEIIRDAVDEKQIKKKDYKLPKVIPILLYTGNGEWKVPDSMKQEVYEELDELGINVKYKPIDMNVYAKEELLDINSMLGYAVLIERCNSNEELVDILEIIAKKIKTEEKAEMLKKIINYVIKQRLNKEQAEKIKEELEKKGVEGAMITLAERLREGDKKLFKKGIAQGLTQGISQGISQGMAQGLKQKQMEIAKKMLDERMQDEFILKITEITEEELKEIKKSK